MSMLCPKWQFNEEWSKSTLAIKKKQNNLAVEVETSPAAAAAPWGGVSTNVDVDDLGDVDLVFSSDASVIPDFKEWGIVLIS